MAAAAAALAAAMVLGGCAGSGSSTAGGTNTRTGPAASSSAGTSTGTGTGTANDVSSSTGQLWSGKAATLSAASAVEHGCPFVYDLDFNRDGLDEYAIDQNEAYHGGDDQEHVDGAKLKWYPPCGSIGDAVNFDAGAVAAVSSMTWSGTVWSAPASSPSVGPPSTGQLEYSDRDITISDALADKDNCGGALLNLANGSPDISYGGGGGGLESAGIYYNASCTGAESLAIAMNSAQVQGTVSESQCFNAAAAGQDRTLIDPTSLKAGAEYCMFDSSASMVALMKVVSVTQSPSTIMVVSLTGWYQPTLGSGD